MNLSKVIVVLAAAALLFAQADSALEKAIRKETLEGDLKGAIDQYKKLAQGKDRGVAAKALVRMGQCYEKLGDAQARKAYERAVRDFSDQTEAVATARARLAALGKPEAARQTTTVVWSGPKVDSEGTISSDGRYLSYPDWATGNLALHDFVSNTDRTLTKEGNRKQGLVDYAEDSAIARDGQQVAYNWYERKKNRYELRIVGTTGDAASRKVFESPEMRYLMPTDWSPDGKWIAVSLEPENSGAATEQPVRPGMQAALGLVGVQDGSLRVLKTTDWTGPNTGYWKILFSPDGKYLAYDRPLNATSHRRGVFVTAIGADRETQVAPGPTHEGKGLAGWSPDGKYLLFTSDRTGTVGLWAIAFANGAPQGEPQLIKPDIGGIGAVGLSAAGALYYCVFPTRDLLRVQVAAFDFATGKLLSPPANLSEEDAEGSSWADWSPDGKNLAYLSQRSGSDFSIKIRAMDTGQIRELRPRLGYGMNLRWAPDGRSLLAQDYQGVYRVDTRSGETSSMIKQPIRTFYYLDPVLSPDGKVLYYSRWENTAKADTVFIELDLVSGKDREIIRGTNLRNLHLSPDGRYIATAGVDPADRSGTFLIIPVGGGEPRVALRAPAEPEGADRKNPLAGTVSILAWAPDSRSVLIRKRLNNANQDAELWQGFVDGSESRMLDGKLDRRLATRGIRLSPDGRRIVLMPTLRGQERSPSQIMVLENFLPTAKAAKAAAR